jgi:hypothetical protein
MLGGSRGVPPGMLVHTLLLQLPLQLWLQPPQFCASDVTSMQALPQSICPEPEQPQTPALHTDPAGQALPHAPQFSALLVTSTQAPFGHRVSPPAHTAWQELALQTCPPLQPALQPPQWVASGATQLPPQSSRPALHRQWPAWQLSPAAQALPHAPQFCWSDVRSLQAAPHLVLPLGHVTAPVPPVPVPVDPP